ncbi:hypothetical protein [Pseudoxanthomonas sp. PXM02]|uniref:hypothetical protein n=1 Tax=Pseudoxanthomonas sp. PXM02 TaxID=2769294 RepID=UPI00177FE2BA|nr:hypothetical protein [Pseudoxanthomonas sp. PXM02]MBD9480068.1 hypothetical protein [Pseudoxanthomonas sp. PXM02]
MVRAVFVALCMCFPLSAMAQSAPDFARADARADAQWEDRREETSAYAEAWAAFNNAHHLDERDGCYFRADGQLTQVLEIDANGKVVGYFTDQDNGRSQCWRTTYLGVVFPKPPFAPYWHKLVMQ